MAYTPAGLKLLDTTIAGTSKTFRYLSTDAHTAVDDTGYFADGRDRGMKVGDKVEAIKTDTNVITNHIVTTVAANGAVTVSAAQPTP